jgi:hypothetical protein
MKRHDAKTNFFSWVGLALLRTQRPRRLDFGFPMPLALHRQ